MHERNNLFEPIQVFVLATHNRHKVFELRDLLADLPVDLRSLTDFPPAPEPEETGDTFLDNARIKALAAHHHTGLPALADDSGIEVAAIGGAPGVRSARYAGVSGAAADQANRDHLLTALGDATDRRARFVCTLVLINSAGTERSVTGICDGRIIGAGESARGSAGFGYDPIFIPDGFTQTFAELGEAVKARVSHRARAVAALRDLLGGRAAG